MDDIRTRPETKEYLDNFDSIFGEKTHFVVKTLFLMYEKELRFALEEEKRRWKVEYKIIVGNKFIKIISKTNLTELIKTITGMTPETDI